MKYLDLNELLTSGLLLEVNRQFFHPRGLAIEVLVDPKDPTKVTGMGKIQDHRDEKGGVVFAPGLIDEGKVANVQQMLEKNEADRRTLFGGTVVQPPNWKPPKATNV